MLDTVRFAAYVADPKRVAAGFDMARVGRDFATGRVGAFRARLSFDRLVLEGSLSTFAGAPVTRIGVHEARERLEEVLGEHLDTAEVWRLDVFADLRLREPVARYLRCLDRRSRFQRYEYDGETVGFRSDARTLAFYDKAAERRRRRKPVPEGNVLRYEMQLKRRVGRQMRRAVWFSDLHSTTFLTRCARRWSEEYGLVQKRHAALPFDGTGSPVRALALAGVSVYGRDVLDALGRAHRDGRITSGQFRGRRQNVLGLARDKALCAPMDLVRELDEQVRKATDEMLAGAE